MTRPWWIQRGAAGALAFALTLAACASTPHAPTVAAARQPASAPATSAAPLAPGDVIAVTAPHAPWLTGLYRVDAEGRVALPRVGTLAARGLTLADVARALEPEADLTDAELAVHARLSGRVAIAGEVRRPGLLVLEPDASLARAIAAVGGVTAWGDGTRVEVVRTLADHPLRFHVSLAREGATFMLEAGDAVVVPTAAQRPAPARRAARE